MTPTNSQRMLTSASRRRRKDALSSGANGAAYATQEQQEEGALSDQGLGHEGRVGEAEVVCRADVGRRSPSRRRDCSCATPRAGPPPRTPPRRRRTSRSAGRASRGTSTTTTPRRRRAGSRRRRRWSGPGTRRSRRCRREGCIQGSFRLRRNAHMVRVENSRVKFSDKPTPVTQTRLGSTATMPATSSGAVRAVQVPRRRVHDTHGGERDRRESPPSPGPRRSRTPRRSVRARTGRPAGSGGCSRGQRWGCGRTSPSRASRKPCPWLHDLAHLHVLDPVLPDVHAVDGEQPEEDAGGDGAPGGGQQPAPARCRPLGFSARAGYAHGGSV